MIRRKTEEMKGISERKSIYDQWTFGYPSQRKEPGMNILQNETHDKTQYL